MDESNAIHLKRLEGEPYFPVAGAVVQGDFIVYAT